MIGFVNSNSLIANRYEFIRKLGAGAMGEVSEVRDLLSGQSVALKQVNLPGSTLALASHLATSDNPRIALANEFQTLASLRHPNIISVLDYGFDRQRRPYFTMNLLDEPFTISEAAADLSLAGQIGLLIQLLQALAYVHRRSVLHRDLKPTNVLVKNGQVHMLDFGLAMNINAGGKSETAGTLAYIAPEVLIGSPATEASDLYSVGVIAYEMFTGQHPFQTDSATNLINDILQTPVDLEEADLPPRLKSVLATLLAKTTQERYTDAYAVIDAFRDAVEGVPDVAESQEIRESFLQAATFVGREAEIGQLSQALRQLKHEGTGSTWLVGGESGVGKSRLIEELRTRALVEGALVLRGQMVSEGGLPYHLWRDILRRLVLVVTVGDSEAPVLKQLVPDIDVLLGYEVEDADDIGMDTQKRLLLIIERIFRRTLATHKIVLILEDLHWSTESLKVLETLNTMVSELPLLIVGSYRNDERPTLPDELPGMQVIPLQRLQAHEIEKLSRSMLGGAGTQDAVVELLQRETEGNIFFIVEVVRTLAEEAGSLTEIGKATLPAAVFAGGVERIIRRRLERVPQWAQEPVKLAAVIGRHIDVTLLSHALPDVDIEQWVTICTNAAVFDIQDEQWRFAHDKLREVILKDLTEAEKQALHKQVAEAIEALHAAELEDYAVMLNYHWAEAGNTVKEGDYAVIAAAQMQTRNDYREMKRLYARAFELNVHERAENPRKKLADLQFGMGRASYLLSDYDAVTEWQTQALDIYRELDDTFGIAEAIAALGEVKMRQFNSEEALSLIQESRRLYESLNESAKVAYAMMNLGIISYNQDDYAVARDYFLQAYDLMEKVGDPISIARSLNNLANITEVLGDSEKAEALHLQALAIRLEINDRHGIAYSMNNLGILYYFRKDYDKAEHYLSEGLKLAHQVGEKLSEAGAYSQLGQLYTQLERYPEAEHAFKQAMNLRQAFDIVGVGQAKSNVGLVMARQGDFTSAWQYYREAIAIFQEKEARGPLRGVLSKIGETHMLQSGDVAIAAEIILFAQQNESNPDSDFTKVVAMLHERLTDTEFNAAGERAQNHTYESIVTLALATDPTQ
ncbi:MAG: tetratricopeptide repeat protein [Aggregatilineales bacterium]